MQEKKASSFNLGKFWNTFHYNFTIPFPPQWLRQKAKVSELDCIELENIYFQQDGAMSPDRFISRKGDHNWTPRSCDLASFNIYFGVT